MIAAQLLYALLVPPLFGMYVARVWLHGGAQIAAVVAIVSYCALVYVIGTSLAVASFSAVEEKLRVRFATRGSG
jgi:NAD-dependent SIR2 family protein deacetylase